MTDWFTQVHTAYLYSPDVPANRVRETAISLTPCLSFLLQFLSFLLKLRSLIQGRWCRLKLVCLPETVWSVFHCLQGTTRTVGRSHVIYRKAFTAMHLRNLSVWFNPRQQDDFEIMFLFLIRVIFMFKTAISEQSKCWIHVEILMKPKRVLVMSLEIHWFRAVLLLMMIYLCSPGGNNEVEKSWIHGQLGN